MTETAKSGLGEATDMGGAGVARPDGRRLLLASNIRPALAGMRETVLKAL